MTAKQKCDELIEKFKPFCFLINEGGAIQQEYAKQCALICVEELIKEHTHKAPISWNGIRLKYWNQVKDEIEKL